MVLQKHLTSFHKLNEIRIKEENYIKSEFTEEELLKKLKEFKQILKEVPGYQKSIVARLSK